MPLGARGRSARSRPRPAEEDRIIDVSVFERGHVTCWVGSLSGGHPGRPDAADRRPPMASRWLWRPVQTGRAVAGRVRWRARLWRHTRRLGYADVGLAPLVSRRNRRDAAGRTGAPGLVQSERTGGSWGPGSTRRESTGSGERDKLGEATRPAPVGRGRG